MKTILSVSLVLAFSTAYSQQIFPVESQKLLTPYALSTAEAFPSDGDGILDSLASGDTSLLSSDPWVKGNPKSRNGSKDSSDIVSADSFDVHIIGLGSANDIASKAGAGGNLALGAMMNFRSDTVGNRLRSHSMYAVYNAQSANTSDTAVVIRTFLFPDIGKRDFTLGYEYNYRKLSSKLRNTFFAEVSWTRNVFSKGADSSFTFHSFNFTTGWKFAFGKTFQIGNDATEFLFSAQPYYQLINVDQKDFGLRNEMLKVQDIPATLHTVGLKATLQLAKLGLFVNAKRMLNEMDRDYPRDLQGTVVVVGALVATDIFKL